MREGGRGEEREEGEGGRDGRGREGTGHAARYSKRFLRSRVTVRDARR